VPGSVSGVLGPIGLRPSRLQGLRPTAEPALHLLEVLPLHLFEGDEVVLEGWGTPPELSHVVVREEPEVLLPLTQRAAWVDRRRGDSASGYRPTLGATVCFAMRCGPRCRVDARCRVRVSRMSIVASDAGYSAQPREPGLHHPHRRRCGLGAFVSRWQPCCLCAWRLLSGSAALVFESSVAGRQIQCRCRGCRF
jgi:hypothetical protein